jgi:hypothetical protein
MNYKKKPMTKLLIFIITVTEETTGHFHFYTPFPCGITALSGSGPPN